MMKKKQKKKWSNSAGATHPYMIQDVFGTFVSLFSITLQLFIHLYEATYDAWMLFRILFMS